MKDEDWWKKVHEKLNRIQIDMDKIPVRDDEERQALIDSEIEMTLDEKIALVEELLQECQALKPKVSSDKQKLMGKAEELRRMHEKNNRKTVKSSMKYTNRILIDQLERDKVRSGSLEPRVQHLYERALDETKINVNQFPLDGKQDDEIAGRVDVIGRLVGGMKEGRQLKEAFVKDVLKSSKHEVKKKNLADILLENQEKLGKQKNFVSFHEKSVRIENVVDKKQDRNKEEQEIDRNGSQIQGSIISTKIDTVEATDGEIQPLRGQRSPLCQTTGNESEIHDFIHTQSSKIGGNPTDMSKNFQTTDKFSNFNHSSLGSLLHPSNRVLQWAQNLNDDKDHHNRVKIKHRDRFTQEVTYFKKINHRALEKLLHDLKVQKNIQTMVEQRTQESKPLWTEPENQRSASHLSMTYSTLQPFQKHFKNFGQRTINSGKAWAIMDGNKFSLARQMSQQQLVKFKREQTMKIFDKDYQTLVVKKAFQPADQMLQNKDLKQAVAVAPLNTRLTGKMWKPMSQSRRINLKIGESPDKKHKYEVFTPHARPVQIQKETKVTTEKLEATPQILSPVNKPLAEILAPEDPDNTFPHTGLNLQQSSGTSHQYQTKQEGSLQHQVSGQSHRSNRDIALNPMSLKFQNQKRSLQDSVPKLQSTQRLSVVDQPSQNSPFDFQVRVQQTKQRGFQGVQNKVPSAFVLPKMKSQSHATLPKVNINEQRQAKSPSREADVDELTQVIEKIQTYRDSTKGATLKSWKPELKRDSPTRKLKEGRNNVHAEIRKFQREEKLRVQQHIAQYVTNFREKNGIETGLEEEGTQEAFSGFS